MIYGQKISNFASFYTPRRYKSSKSLQDCLRKFMRCVPHPVVIITTCCSKTPELCRGITVSSFNTLCMTDHPLVSFNIQLPSRFADLLRQSSKFIVNVPKACREHATLARSFSTPRAFEEDHKLFESTNWSTTTFGPLALTDALGRLHCEVLERIPVKDHELIIGRANNVYDLSRDADTDALLYVQGNYCSLGEKI